MAKGLVDVTIDSDFAYRVEAVRQSDCDREREREREGEASERNKHFEISHFRLPLDCRQHPEFSIWRLETRIRWLGG